MHQFLSKKAIVIDGSFQGLTCIIPQFPLIQDFSVAPRRSSLRWGGGNAGRDLILGPHVWLFCSKQGSSGCWGHPQAARHPSAPTHLFFVTLGASSRADFPTGLADLGIRIAWLRNKVLVYIKYTHKIKNILVPTNRLLSQCRK